MQVETHAQAFAQMPYDRLVVITHQSPIQPLTMKCTRALFDFKD